MTNKDDGSGCLGLVFAFLIGLAIGAGSDEEKNERAVAQARLDGMSAQRAIDESQLRQLRAVCGARCEDSAP